MYILVYFVIITIACLAVYLISEGRISNTEIKQYNPTPKPKEDKAEKPVIRTKEKFFGYKGDDFYFEGEVILSKDKTTFHAQIQRNKRSGKYILEAQAWGWGPVVEGSELKGYLMLDRWFLNEELKIVNKPKNWNLDKWEFIKHSYSLDKAINELCYLKNEKAS